MGGAGKGGEPVGVALIGSGRMGSFHGETLARRIPGARLVAVADPAPDTAARLAAALGADRAYTDPAEALADPAVDAVRAGGTVPAGGEDARAALAIALAAAESVRTGRPVWVHEVAT